MSSYSETISEIVRVCKVIGLSKSSEDGRIDSAFKEKPFLDEMKKTLLADHPTWDVVISPPRAACDVMVNSIRINLKLTDCKSSDNSMSKPSVYYSITGLTNYPASSNWNTFFDRIANGSPKKIRDKATEYHYLVKNKMTGDVLLKPIFDIHTYVSNPSNNLQINWKNEFANIEYAVSDAEYLPKVQSLLRCIQKSVRDMIENSRRFAEADFAFCA
jgi:hypothetical protein